MKTTLNIPDDVARDAKLRAVEERKTFTDMVVEGLALRLARSAPSIPLPVSAARGGLQRGVEWSDLEAASEDHR